MARNSSASAAAVCVHAPHTHPGRRLGVGVAGGREEGEDECDEEEEEPVLPDDAEPSVAADRWVNLARLDRVSMVVCRQSGKCVFLL